MNPLVVLGATGSIGRQALEIADHLGLEVVGLAASSPSPELSGIAASYPGARLAVANPGEAQIPGLVGFGVGAEAISELAATPGTTLINGIVGSAGLSPTLAALRAGNRVALANKESLVAGGELVRRTLDEGVGELIPVDSEHSAIFQCLQGESGSEVSRIILTASGGPFRGWSRPEMAQVTAEQALQHPTWNMGGRITIDSATLVNKGLEVIEAHHLFGFSFDQIDVVVHPQSILHSAVEMGDGAIKGHLGNPDMRHPIQYAITYPRRLDSPAERFSLAGSALTFEPVDRTAFPALDLAFEVGRRGGSAPAVFNAADEVAVAAFLDGRIGFLDIVEVISRTVAQLGSQPVSDLASVLAVDAEAREVAEDFAATSSRARQVG